MYFECYVIMNLLNYFFYKSAHFQKFKKYKILYTAFRIYLKLC